MSWVAFDLDGTLFDSVGMTVRAVREVLARFEVDDVAEDTVRRTIGKPIEELNAWLIEEVGERYADEVVSAFVAAERELMPLEAGLYDGVERMLTDVRSVAGRVALYSNARVRYVTRVLDQTGIGDRFDLVRPRSPEEPGKSPIVADLVRQLGADGTLVGDRREDVTSAHEHGLRAIGAAYGYGDEGELDDAEATVAAPDAIVAVLERLTT